MAEIYSPSLLSNEYSAEQLQQEFAKIASALEELTLPLVVLVPQHNEPARRQEGMVAFADGTNWNPGATGAGLYQYVGGAWVKL